MDIYNLAKIMEQIKEATVQIDKNTTTGSRLALILIDNALEISMWEKINNEYSPEDYEAIINKTFKEKYPDFKDKTNFLVSDSIIEQGTKDIFDTCHHFRNEVYHKNITKESIINDLAKIYLEECCKVIFKLLDCSFYSISTQEPVPKILIEYGIISTSEWIGYDIIHDLAGKINEVVNSFLNGRVCCCRSFSQTLASDIIKRTEKVRDDIDYIKSFSGSSGIYKDEQRNHNSFLDRAEKVKNANNISNALVRYSKIDDELTPIELFMDYWSGVAAYHVDLQLQQYREEQYEKNDSL
jgi:uncharacterized protein YutE (UPF0331/DUF86 family)